MSSPLKRLLHRLGAGLVVATLAATIASVTPATPAAAENPIVTTAYTADPAPLVHDGRVYVYTGHDEDSATDWFDMRDWRVYSSSDMANWTDHGSPMSLATFSWASANAWAGHVIERNGKFYYYVPVTERATGRFAIGVAVADNPTGPFRDALGKPLLYDTEIDPAAFIDDDGQAYLYWGNPNLWYVRLNPDMISFSGARTQIPLTTEGYGTRIGNAQRPTLFEEAPWIYKRNGLYYNVFAADCCPEYLAYSTAPSPTGPWTYGGTVMTREGGTGTNHAGVIDFKGESYIFYQNAAAPGGDGVHRSVAVERFSYGADGSIPTIPMSVSGPAQRELLNPYVRQEAETMAGQSGLETERSTEGALNVWNIENGDWLKVKGVGFGAGAASFSARVASGGAGGTLEIRLDSPSGPVAGRCTVTPTGGWQSWTTVNCATTGAIGTRDVYFRFTGGPFHLFNFNSWQFAPAPAVTASASTRCIAGKVVLTVVANNAGNAPQSIALATSYGSKTVTAEAGKSASAVFSTRSASSAAGTATATLPDSPTTAPVVAAYPARTC